MKNIALKKRIVLKPDVVTSIDVHVAVSYKAILSLSDSIANNIHCIENDIVRDTWYKNSTRETPLAMTEELKMARKMMLLEMLEEQQNLEREVEALKTSIYFTAQCLGYKGVDIVDILNPKEETNAG